MSAAATRELEGGHLALTSPGPGLFRAAVAIGDVVHAGSRLGELEVLGKLTAIIAPPGAGGVVIAIADRTLARAPVEFGTALVTLDPRGAAAGADAGPVHASAAAAATAGGLVFRAPTSGRFYGRSSPDKPAFVEVGTELAAGTTICLLEVMKTFHRVTYGGSELPARARVRAVLVSDGADVNAQDPLLALDPL